MKPRKAKHGHVITIAAPARSKKAVSGVLGSLMGRFGDMVLSRFSWMDASAPEMKGPKLRMRGAIVLISDLCEDSIKGILRELVLRSGPVSARKSGKPRDSAIQLDWVGQVALSGQNLRWQKDGDPTHPSSFESQVQDVFAFFNGYSGDEPEVNETVGMKLGKIPFGDQVVRIRFESESEEEME
ncbi:MAG: hypothetical protein JW706_07080 [Opitutales bacterium]|nr:hypothetical protein [Opitutales bacterium]